MATPRPRRLHKLLRAGLAVVLVAGAAEAALRAAGRLYLRNLYVTSFQSLDPRPGDVNVLCLGESSTAGLGVDPAESYVGQLQALLRDFYDEPRIRTIVPPHVGQNTSQMANRIGDYLGLYTPRLVLVMAGYNNEWSLAESHVTRFLEGRPAQTWRVRALVFLDGFRLFKLLRYGCLRTLTRERSAYLADNAQYVFGHPELVRFPPAPWVYSFARQHAAAFAAAWREDVTTIVRESRARGARPLLMTYHLNPSYLPQHEFVALATKLGVPLVRNDAAFAELARAHGSSPYLLDDGWHPSPSGYAEIARNAFQVIWRADLLGLTPPPAGNEAKPRRHWSGERLALGTAAADPYLGDGFGAPEVGPESAFRWTDGRRAELFLDLSARERRVLRMRLDPFLVPEALARQRLNILVDGCPAARWSLAEPVTRVHSVLVPEREMGGRASLTFVLPDARAPAGFGLNDDRRSLGVALEWISLEDFPVDALGHRIELRAEEAEKYLGSGWTAAEGSVRWMQAPRAELLFRRSGAGSLLLRIKVRAQRPRGLAAPSMTLDLNGWRILAFDVTLTDVLPAVYSVALPAGSLEDRNVLAFEWPSAGPLALLPEPPGLAVEWLELVR